MEMLLSREKSIEDSPQAVNVRALPACSGAMYSMVPTIWPSIEMEASLPFS